MRNTSSAGIYLNETPSDPHQAARWFQLAATKGHCRAEAALGDMLFQGQSVPRQAARGLMWLTLGQDCAGPDDTWAKPLYDSPSSTPATTSAPWRWFIWKTG